MENIQDTFNKAGVIYRIYNDIDLEGGGQRTQNCMFLRTVP